MPFRRCSSLKAATGPYELGDSLTFSDSFTAHLSRGKTTAEARRHPPAPSIPPPLMSPALLSLSERSNHIRLSFPTALHPRTNMCRAPFPVFHCRLPFSLLLKANRFAASQIRLRPFPVSGFHPLRSPLPSLLSPGLVLPLQPPPGLQAGSSRFSVAAVPPGGHSGPCCLLPFSLSLSRYFPKKPEKEQLKTKSPLERGLFS